jgi:methionyl-tRNA synthetase
LRYYYASKLSSKVEDIDLSFEDFVNRVNAELVNKIVNLYSRLVPFVTSRLDNRLGPDSGERGPEAAEVKKLLHDAEAAYLDIDHARAIANVLAIADIGNKYFQDNKPWERIKSDVEGTRNVCTLVANICKAVTIGIKPVLPLLAEQTEKMLALAPVNFRTPLFDMKNQALGQPQRLIERVEAPMLDKIVEESKTDAAPAKTVAVESKPEITYDAFATMDLRVAKILSAERVPKSDKLLKLQVDVGEAQPRQVIAGIGLAYEPTAVVGKTVVCLANLKPAKLMGLESRAMLLAAGSGGKDLALCELPASLAAGTSVK